MDMYRYDGCTHYTEWNYNQPGQQVFEFNLDSSNHVRHLSMRI